MCGLFTCIPILGVFIFLEKKNKKGITGLGFWIYYKAVPIVLISHYFT